MSGQEPHIEEVFKAFYDSTLPEAQVEHAHNIAWHLAQAARSAAFEIRQATTVLAPTIRATDKLSLWERLEKLDKQAELLEQALKLADGKTQ